jgi:hypothetical protein
MESHIICDNVKKEKKINEDRNYTIEQKEGVCIR